ncbi:SRPBCC family protein, partial [Bacillus cereus]|nr:SRPBCC family protein [Bacillus cereus]
TALTLISEYEPSNFYYKMMYKLTGWISRGLTMEQMERLAECVEAAYHKED